jgi:hypothetical protein
MEGGGIKHYLHFPGITGPPQLMDDIFPAPMLILPHVIDRIFTVTASYIWRARVH